MSVIQLSLADSADESSGMFVSASVLNDSAPGYVPQVVFERPKTAESVRVARRGRRPPAAVAARDDGPTPLPRTTPGGAVRPQTVAMELGVQDRTTGTRPCPGGYVEPSGRYHLEYVRLLQAATASSEPKPSGGRKGATMRGGDDDASATMLASTLRVRTTGTLRPSIQVKGAYVAGPTSGGPTLHPEDDDAASAGIIVTVPALAPRRGPHSTARSVRTEDDDGSSVTDRFPSRRRRPIYPSGVPPRPRKGHRGPSVRLPPALAEAEADSDAGE